MATPTESSEGLDEKLARITKKGSGTDFSDATLQAANDGVEEQQLIVGKHFLSLAEAGVNVEENGNEAVSWLIKASRQGNVEATTLLSRCLENKLGTKEEVLPEMAWCIKTSPVEKKVRHAARGLFWQINQSRKSVLTRDEYLDAVTAFAKSRLEKSVLTSAAKRLGNEISEAQFVKAVSKQIQGKVIPTTEETSLKEAEYESAGTLVKLTKFPRQTMASVMNQGLELASKEGTSWLVSLIPVNQIQIMLLLFAYSFLTPSFLFLVIPLFCFYLSFFGMVVSTLQMFYGRRKLSNVTTWAKMMEEHDVGIDLETAQSQFMWNSLTPYMVFFSSLFFTVASFSLAEKSYIPCSEVCLLAGAFAVLSFIALSDSYDFLLVISVFCSFMSTLPTFMSGFPYIPVFTWLISFLFSPITYIQVGSLFRINIGLPSLSYVIVPVFFVRMAMKNSWQGTYRILVPHLVCYFWWNFMGSLFPFTTWMGLIRAGVGYALMPVMLPAMIVGGVGYGFYTILVVMKSDVVGKLLVTLLLLCIPLVLTKSKLIFGSKFEEKYGSAKKVLMISLGVLSVLPLAFIRIPTYKVVEAPPLPWETYIRHCWTPGDANMVGEQIKCAHLTGVRVNWSGVVRSVKITQVDNSVEKFLNGLPTVFGEYLKCVYGQRYPICDAEVMTEQELDTCELMKANKHTCHVKEHNVLTFQLTVDVGEGADARAVWVKADNKFKETVLALEPSDQVTFTALLKDGLGGPTPQVNLRQLTCTNRELPVMQIIEDELESLYDRKINEVVKVAFHFVWYPFLEYVP